jgi:hypothetical protein
MYKNSKINISIQKSILDFIKWYGYFINIWSIVLFYLYNLFIYFLFIL